MFTPREFGDYVQYLLKCMILVHNQSGITLMLTVGCSELQSKSKDKGVVLRCLVKGQGHYFWSTTHCIPTIHRRRSRSGWSGFGRTTFIQGKNKKSFLQKASNEQKC